jgi:hypothetical protein
MKTLIRLAKGLGVFLAACILFVIVVINFGTVERRFVCSGQVQRQVDGGDPVTTPATLYAQVETYRWIVFWADHDAMIRWEVQPGGDTGFGYYNHSSFATPITDLNRNKTYGSFSGLSNRIHVVTSIDGSEAFEGMCK